MTTNNTSRISLVRRSQVSIVALLLAVSFGQPALAQSDTALGIRSLLEERDQEIKQLLSVESLADTQREQLKDLINGVIDFEAMGETALGPHWGDLTANQKEEFVAVFSDIVRSQSVSDLDVYRSSVAYADISVDGTKAVVETVTSYKGTDTPVVYEMHKAAQGWMVTDIILNDVSTAQGYARSFQGLIRKRGFDVLMEKLRARRDAS